MWILIYGMYFGMPGAISSGTATQEFHTQKTCQIALSAAQKEFTKQTKNSMLSFMGICVEK